MLPPIPAGWPDLRAERDRPYFREMESFLDGEYREQTVYPPRADVFRALELTSREDVRVVLLGQDPYHRPGQAHGLAFSVRRGVPKPPSLRNLLRELNDDLDVPIPQHGDLTSWARRGVLLLNAVLTVREGEPGSHARAGWKTFTDAVIRRVTEQRSRVVFLLLGAQARKKALSVDLSRHAVVRAAHPSPLSAWRGFLGSGVFSAVNGLLVEGGRGAVDWSLPD